MKLITKELAKNIPKLRATEKQDDPVIHLKFFDPTGSWNWYVTEAEEQEPGHWVFFGLVDGFELELGYFSLDELIEAKKGITGIRALPIERDLYFKPKRLSEVRKERENRG